jgi:hypothetical protein
MTSRHPRRWHPLRGNSARCDVRLADVGWPGSCLMENPRTTPRRHRAYDGRDGASVDEGHSAALGPHGLARWRCGDASMPRWSGAYVRSIPWHAVWGVKRGWPRQDSLRVWVARPPFTRSDQCSGCERGTTVALGHAPRVGRCWRACVPAWPRTAIRHRSHTSSAGLHTPGRPQAGIRPRFPWAVTGFLSPCVRRYGKKARRPRCPSWTAGGSVSGRCLSAPCPSPVRRP